MLSVASVMMNGCGSRPVDVDDAVDGADGGAGEQHHERSTTGVGSAGS